MSASSAKANQYKPSVFWQVLLNFAIPIFILTKLSSKSELGPTKGFLLALAFPVGYELYSIYKRRKISLLSLSVIGGILITGAIGLLGLSEGWLAIRRSAIYFLIAVTLLALQILKPQIIKQIFGKVIDLDKIYSSSNDKQVIKQMDQIIRKTVYGLSALFFMVAAASYVLTLVVIKSPTNSESFNQEYAELRIISLVAITLPMILGFLAAVVYFSLKLKKTTGLDLEHIVIKR